MPLNLDLWDDLHQIHIRFSLLPLNLIRTASVHWEMIDLHLLSKEQPLTATFRRVYDRFPAPFLLA